MYLASLFGTIVPDVYWMGLVNLQAGVPLHKMFARSKARSLEHVIGGSDSQK